MSRIGAALHALLHPGHAEERERLEAIARAARVVESGQREQLEALRREMDKLHTRLDRIATEKKLHAVDRRVEQLSEAAGRQYRVTAQALKHAKWNEEHRVHERRILARLAKLAASDHPVLVGPWSGEVGFELLYWIPFVTWALRQARVAPERVLVVSRGGAAPWYAHLGGRYVDVLSYVTAEEFRAHTEEAKKQRSMGPFDRRVARQVLKAEGLTRAHLLHPGLMYRLFNPFWKQQMTVRRVEAFAEHAPIARPDATRLAGRLPADYVAVRFYFSASFPDTPENRAFVDSVIRSLAETTDVVLLNTAFNLDDHRDYVPGDRLRIHSVDDLMTPDRNLDVQTSVIAGARAFVGTYGGYAYLAPLCGVSSLAFYSERDAFFAHHLELADRVFRRLNVGALVPIDVRTADLLRSVLAPRIVAADVQAGGPGR
ncbi:MAG: hypothetical protein ACRD26_05710 [Vicinamibacterales bacterium]